MTVRKHLQRGQEAGANRALAIPREAGRGGAGSRRGRLAGQSIDFRDYRDYQPGDDLRAIDWSAYARSDRLTVKLFHEEVCPHLDLILDTSRSMALADSAKEAAAVGLAAAIATAAANAGCSYQLWATGDGIAPVPNGSGLPAQWDRIRLDATCPPDEAFALRPPALRPNGIRVFVSDLLWEGAPDIMLRRLSDRATATTVIQVLAKADVNPGEAGNLRLVDAETGEMLELFLDETARSRYAGALARHQEEWSEACRRCGAATVRLIAEDVTTDWDLAALRRIGLLEVV